MSHAIIVESRNRLAFEPPIRQQMSTTHGKITMARVLISRHDVAIRWAKTWSLLLSLMVGLAPGASPALAGAEVTGQVEGFELRVNNASTRDVLDALARAFGLTYRLPAEASREINGRY